MDNCSNCLRLDKTCKCKKTNTDNILYSGPNLPCSSVAFNDPLTLVLQKIDAQLCSGLNQDNFVRDLLINVNDLPINYTTQDICDYILALPEIERTILETDSKWNIIIFEASS